MNRKLMIALSGALFLCLGLSSTAFAKITVYPANMPGYEIKISKGSCSVNGQAGTVVTMGNGSEGCMITTASAASPSPTKDPSTQAAEVSGEAQQPTQKK